MQIADILPFIADGHDIPCFGASFDDLIEAEGTYIVEDKDVPLKVEMIDFWGNTQGHEAVHDNGRLVSDVRPHGHNFVAIIMVSFGLLRVAFKGFHNENPWDTIMWEPIGLHALTGQRLADWRGAYPPADYSKGGTPMPSKFITPGFLGNCFWEQVAYDEGRDATFYGNGMWFPSNSWEEHYRRPNCWQKPSPPKGGWNAVRNSTKRRRLQDTFNRKSNLFHKYSGAVIDEVAQDYLFKPLLSTIKKGAYLTDSKASEEVSTLMKQAPRWFVAAVDKLVFYQRNYLSLSLGLEKMEELGEENDNGNQENTAEVG